MNFLIDTGSQVSIINHDKIKHSKVEGIPAFSVLKSLGLNRQMRGFDVNCKVEFPGAELVPVKFFAINNLDISMRVEGMEDFLLDFQKYYKLSNACPAFRNDEIKIDGILRADVIGNIPFF